jgi:hypothetical protein
VAAGTIARVPEVEPEKVSPFTPVTVFVAEIRTPESWMILPVAPLHLTMAVSVDVPGPVIEEEACQLRIPAPLFTRVVFAPPCPLGIVSEYDTTALGAVSVRTPLVDPENKRERTFPISPRDVIVGIAACSNDPVVPLYVTIDLSVTAPDVLVYVVAHVNVPDPLFASTEFATPCAAGSVTV